MFKKITAILILLLLLAAVFTGCQDTKKEMVTITFETYGGTEISPIKVEKGDKPDWPPEPTRYGYKFEGWYFDSAFENRVNQNVFKAISNITLYALWKSNENYPHKIIFDDISYATVLTDKEDDSAKFDETVIITVRPAAGYAVLENTAKAQSEHIPVVVLTEIQTEGVAVGDIKQYSFKMPAEDVHFTVSLDKRYYSVSVVQTPNGRLVAETDRAKAGDTVKVTLIPDPGYEFTRMYVNDAEYSANSFIMPPSDVQIIPEFEKNDSDFLYPINIAPSENGTITTSLSQAAWGKVVTVTAAPDGGYRLKELFLNGVLLEYGFFVMPSKTAVVSATFEEIDYGAKKAPIIQSSPYGAAETDRETYAAGEKITLTVTQTAGYILDGILLNGRFTDISNLIMSADECLITPVFVKIPYKINLNYNSEGGALVADRAEAYKGDIIVISIFPNLNYKIKDGTLKLNGQSYDGGALVMGEQDLTVSVQFELISEPVGTEYYGLTFALSEPSAGSVSWINGTAREGEIIYPLLSLSAEYRLIDFTVNGRTVTTAYFVMPREDASVTVNLQKLYKITGYDAVSGVIMPDREYAAQGETVNVFAKAKGRYKISLLFYDGLTTGIPLVNLSFVMPAIDVRLGGDFILPPDTPEYTLTMGSAAGGSLKANLNKAAEGVMVHITVTPQTGYKLDKLYYKDTDIDGNPLEIELECSFKMPAKNLTVYPKFIEEEEAVNLSLKQLYDRRINQFAETPFTVHFTDKLTEIRNLTAAAGVAELTANVKAILSVRLLGHGFIAIEYGDDGTLSAFANAVYAEYPEAVCKLYNSFIILSFDGNAEENYRLLVNGARKYGDFLLYDRGDGSLGVYYHLGFAARVNIPEEAFGMTVSYIASHAFENGDNVLTLHLGDVRTVEEGAFDKLTKLTSIDLSNITEMKDDALKYAVSLEKIYVASYNQSFSAVDGVLHNKGSLEAKLLRYPAAAAATSYKIGIAYGTICEYAFYGAKNLRSVDFSNVSTIEAYAFKDCENLVSTTAAPLNTGKVKDYGRYAFDGCTGIEYVNFSSARHVQTGVFHITTQPQLLIELGTNTSIDGEDDFISRIGNLGGNIFIRCQERYINTFRKNPFFRSYTQFFTVTAQDLSGGKKIILFESNGGTYINCILTNANTISAPTPPVKEGYTFLYWYRNSESQPFNFNVNLTEDRYVLYAKWEE